MLLSILLKYSFQEVNKQNIYKLLTISCIIYMILQYFFKNYIIILAIFDSLGFISNFINFEKLKEINTPPNNNSKKIAGNNEYIGKLLSNIKHIDKVQTNDPVDPELITDNYKLYSFNLKNTISELVNNINS